jgi:hypothetical protein
MLNPRRVARPRNCEITGVTRSPIYDNSPSHTNLPLSLRILTSKPDTFRRSALTSSGVVPQIRYPHDDGSNQPSSAATWSSISSPMQPMMVRSPRQVRAPAKRFNALVNVVQLGLRTSGPVTMIIGRLPAVRWCMQANKKAP